MARTVGCDIGEQATKVAVLDGSPKKPKLVDFHVVPTPEELGAYGHGHVPLGELLKDRKLPKDQVAISFPSRNAIFRSVTLPFLDEDQVAKTIKFEAESFLYSINIDDVVVTHFLTGADAERSHVLVGAIKKNEIRKRLRALEPFDVDPPIVELDVTAMADALRATGFLEEHPQALVLDLGARGARLAAFSEGRVSFVRSLRVGFVPAERRVPEPEANADGEDEGRKRNGNGRNGGGIADHIARHERAKKGEPEPDAEAPMRLPDLEAPDLDAAALASYFEKVARELTASLAAMSLREPIGEIWVTGGGLLLPDALTEIEKRTRLAARRLDLLARMDHAIPTERQDEVIPFLPIALGLGLRQMGLEGVGPDLRQEDLRFTKRFDQLKLSLAALSFVAVIFLLLQNMYLYWNRKVDRYSLQTLHARAEGSRLRTLPQVEIDDSLGYFDKIQQIALAFGGWREQLMNELGRSSQIPELDSGFEVSVDFWDALARASTRMTGPMRLTLLHVRIDKQLREIMLDGHIAKGSDLDALMNAFEAEPWVRSVTRPPLAPSDAGGFDFKTLKLELKDDLRGARNRG